MPTIEADIIFTMLLSREIETQVSGSETHDEAFARILSEWQTLPLRATDDNKLQNIQYSHDIEKDDDNDMWVGSATALVAVLTTYENEEIDSPDDVNSVIDDEINSAPDEVAESLYDVSEAVASGWTDRRDYDWSVVTVRDLSASMAP